MTFNGIELLNRPLPHLDRLSLSAMFNWLVSGLRAAAPPSIREFNWRPVYLLMAPEPSLVERSWLGASRKTNLAGELPPHLPRYVSLAPDTVFLITVNLPAEARSTLREAVGHRLENFSPLPAAEIEFAVGGMTPLSDNRLLVEVAIVRKKSIAELEGASSPTAPAVIGAEAGEDGSFRFIFKETMRSKSENWKFGPAMAAIAGGIFLLAGSNFYIDRKIEALATYERQLIDVLKAERAKFAILSDLPNKTDASEDIAASLAELGRIADSLPVGVWIEQANLTPTAIELTGFAQRTAEWPDGLSATIADSDRPNIARYSLRKDLSPQ